MNRPAYVRDRFTWMIYLSLGYFAYLQTVPGPTVPFLRDELQMNYTVTGLHLTAFALGMLLIGLVGERVIARFGRYYSFWGGLFGMAIGAVLIIFTWHPFVSMAGMFVMGFIGTILLTTLQSSIADYHGENGTIGLTESNVIAVIFAAISPQIIALGEQTDGLGWRFAWWVMVFFGIGLFAVFGRVAFPSPTLAKEQQSNARPLSTLFWLYWSVVVFSIALEWSLIYWGADFLQNIALLPATQASSLMSLFFVAMIIGRIVGGRLVQRYDARVFLWVAIVTFALGFSLFWLMPSPVVRVLGLFIAGVGSANLYPLTLSIAIKVSGNQADKASSRVVFGVGLSIVVFPQVLGGLADQVGIWNAFGIVPILLISIIIANGFAQRVSRQMYSSEKVISS